MRPHAYFFSNIGGYEQRVIFDAEVNTSRFFTPQIENSEQLDFQKRPIAREVSTPMFPGTEQSDFGVKPVAREVSTSLFPDTQEEKTEQPDFHARLLALSKKIGPSLAQDTSHLTSEYFLIKKYTWENPPTDDQLIADVEVILKDKNFRGFARLLAVKKLYLNAINLNRDKKFRGNLDNPGVLDFHREYEARVLPKLKELFDGYEVEKDVLIAHDEAGAGTIFNGHKHGKVGKYASIYSLSLVPGSKAMQKAQEKLDSLTDEDILGVVQSVANTGEKLKEDYNVLHNFYVATFLDVFVQLPVGSKFSERLRSIVYSYRNEKLIGIIKRGVELGVSKDDFYKEFSPPDYRIAFPEKAQEHEKGWAWVEKTYDSYASKR